MTTPSDIPRPEVAAVLLDSLRPSLDRARWDEFGDRVWLKPYIVDGRRVGITQCCLVEAPCDDHAGWTDGAS